MPATFPEEIFDDEDGRPERWSGPDSAQGRKPAPERRHAARRRTAAQANLARPAGRPSPMPDLTPTEWLAQWCSLDKEK